MTTAHIEDIKISNTACPRCQCHLVSHFECDCGEVHSDYCVNCRRWLDLGPTEHIELSEIDVACSAGPVDHAHLEEEKIARIDAFFSKNSRNN